MQFSKLFRTTSLSLGVAIAASQAATAQRVSLPAGSVLIVRTSSALQSATAQSGQTFESTVDESVGVDEYTVIPAGSRVRGSVVTARAATRQQSGVIELVFDRLLLPDGSSIPIRGKLTSTDSAERRQIKSDPNARVVLVGGRGGIGAAIAGAGSAKGANNLLSALGSMLSEGRDVNVAAGTQLAVELETAVALRGGRRMRDLDPSTILTSPARVREAQTMLVNRNYLRGTATGRLDDATRRALFQFQTDNRLNATGNLDVRTAQALGLNLSVGATTAAGLMLSADDASNVRRDASTVVSSYRTALGISNAGRADPSRTYLQADIELWFALSAFAENAASYEELVRGGGNQNAAVIAGRSLVNAAQRVDTALANARVTSDVQVGWDNIRRRLATLRE